jgi:hypothetical protein
MKNVFFMALSLVLTFTACNKANDGIEVIGNFGDALTGFEGTITYADGRPAKGYPVRMQIGIAGTMATFSSTGAILGVSGEPNSFLSDTLTDENGRYKITSTVKKLPIGFGFCAGLGFGVGSGFEHFQTEYIVDNNGNPQNPLQNNFNFVEYGKIKKIDVKLYESSILFLDSRQIEMNYDRAEFILNKFSPISGEEVALKQGFDLPPTGGAYFIMVLSKPKIPINLTVKLYKNNQVFETRTMRILMTKKENYMDIIK